MEHRFFTKTRKGKVGCIVRESYRSNNIGFGFLLQKQLSTADIEHLLTNSLHRTIFFIDTNIALHHIDLLEVKSTLTEIVVVPHTVLKELRNLNYSVYKRLFALLKNDQRTFIFLPNENHESIESERLRDETVNDAHDRFIVNAAIYYQQSIDAQLGQVTLVTNDEGNQKRAQQAGLTVYNMRVFVNKFGDSSMSLTDFGIPAVSSSSSSSSSLTSVFPTTIAFPAYVRNDEIKAGLKTGKYFKGVIRSKSNDRRDCYVILSNFTGKDRKSVTVRGEVNVNRAIEGDIVAIELIVAPSSSSSSSAAEKDTQYLDIEGIDETKSTSSTSVSNQSLKQSSTVNLLFGRVVGILQRNNEQYAGSIDPSSVRSVVLAHRVSGDGEEEVEEEEEYYVGLFVPTNKRVPSIVISSRRLTSLLEYRLLAVIDEWASSSQYPTGHCLKVLGKKGEKDIETKLILLEYGVPNEEFTTEVMACLPPSGWEITKEEIAKRHDCRHLPIASVDPPGCKDIDDALHCIALENGHYQIGVHIADVSHFVLPDTPIDLEASHRSTSTYLVERRLDMLPGLLTTQLCSLRSDEDHLAFSVFWEMDTNGAIYDVQFHKTVIRSVASLTYDQAQTILDGQREGFSQPLVDSIIMLNHFAKILRQRRFDAGALTLVSPEVRFKLDEETRDPTDVVMYNLKQAHAMVEEWMLLANITVAKKTLLHYPTLSILRRHQSPSQEQLQPLIKAAKIAGFHLDITTSKTLATSLDAAVKPEDSYFNSLLRILATRCMMPAQYFCSGEISKDAWFHYGLATPVYTHFTSPIRRYADVLVHRLLAAAIGVAPLPLANTDRAKQHDVCAHMNRRHRLAQYAQRSSVTLHTTIFFANKQVVEDAYIIGMKEDGIDVLVPKYGIEEAITLSSITRNFVNKEINIDLENYRITFGTSQSVEQSGAREKQRSNEQSEYFSLQIFQKIRVRISVEEENGEKKLLISLV